MDVQKWEFLTEGHWWGWGWIIGGGCKRGGGAEL